MPDYTKHDELTAEIDRLTQALCMSGMMNLPTEEDKRREYRQHDMRLETELAIAKARLEAERGRLIAEALEKETYDPQRKFREQAQIELTQEAPQSRWKYITDKMVNERANEIERRAADKKWHDDINKTIEYAANWNADKDTGVAYELGRADERKTQDRIRLEAVKLAAESATPNQGDVIGENIKRNPNTGTVD